MKTLIVYYSYSGNNEKLAWELKERMGCDIHKISEVKKRKTISIMFEFFLNRKSILTMADIEVKDYSKIILIAPIWGSKIASPMRAFIESQHKNLGKYFFISICNGEVGQKEKLDAELNSLILHKPSEVAELWINNILPEDKKNKIKHTFSFRVTKPDLAQFDEEIKSFIRLVNI